MSIEQPLMAPVQVDTVGVEKDSVLSTQELRIDGHDEGKDNQRKGSHELIHIFITNYRKGTRIVKYVVVRCISQQGL
jgi:hypothetical protein